MTSILSPAQNPVSHADTVLVKRSALAESTPRPLRSLFRHHKGRATFRMNY